MQRVAFIGTGIMGAPIAGHILDAGYPLTVFNRTPEKAQGLIERGAVWAETAADAARDADVVFTMVGYPEDVEELYLAGDGLIAASKPVPTLSISRRARRSLARDIAEASAVEGSRCLRLPGDGRRDGCHRGDAHRDRWRHRADDRAGPRDPRDVHLEDLLLRSRRAGPGRQACQPGRARLVDGGYGRRALVCPARRARSGADARDDPGRYGCLGCARAAGAQGARRRLEAPASWSSTS